MMRTAVMLGIVLGAVAVLAATGLADIVVLNNGQVFEGKISSAAGGNLKLSSEYGEQEFPKKEVSRYFLTPEGMEAEGYYQAGLLLANKGKRDTARQLFGKCVKYDGTYRDKCNTALSSAAASVPGVSPAEGKGPGTVARSVSPPGPKATVVKVQCPGCQGSGIVMGSSAINPDRGTERPRPCPLCGGRGYKILQIPPGYEMCSSCGGFGASLGSGGGSDKSGFTNRKTICGRCAGRGIVKAPWRPPEEGSGGEGSGSVMMVASPSPGSPPPRPMSARERAKSVASGGPAGRRVSRPVGPSGIRPVSPTVMAEVSSPEENEEEIIEDDSGGSSETASDESTEETEENESEEEVDADYTPPGLIGWLKSHRLYVILGGVVLIVFAVVFSKMSGKK